MPKNTDKTSPEKEPKEPSFEESMAALEALIEKLESPETPLEVIVKSFAEAQKLLKTCQKRLNEVELILESADNKSN